MSASSFRPKKTSDPTEGPTLAPASPSLPRPSFRVITPLKRPWSDACASPQTPQGIPPADGEHATEGHRVHTPFHWESPRFRDASPPPLPLVRQVSELGSSDTHIPARSAYDHLLPRAAALSPRADKVLLPHVPEEGSSRPTNTTTTTLWCSIPRSASMTSQLSPHSPNSPAMTPPAADLLILPSPLGPLRKDKHAQPSSVQRVVPPRQGLVAHTNPRRSWSPVAQSPRHGSPMSSVPFLLRSFLSISSECDLPSALGPALRVCPDTPGPSCDIVGLTKAGSCSGGSDAFSGPGQNGTQDAHYEGEAEDMASPGLSGEDCPGVTSSLSSSSCHVGNQQGGSDGCLLQRLVSVEGCGVPTWENGHKEPRALEMDTLEMEEPDDMAVDYTFRVDLEAGISTAHSPDFYASREKVLGSRHGTPIRRRSADFVRL